MVEHDDSTVSYFIDCNNAGAQFVHAAADGVTVANILKPVYVPPIVHSFFPLNGVLNYEGVSKPFLAVQVTELVDGIFIAKQKLSRLKAKANAESGTKSISSLQSLLAHIWKSTNRNGQVIDLDKEVGLKEQQLGYVALQINKVVSSYTEVKVKGTLESLKENLNPRTMGELAPTHCLFISSSPRFNIYGTDFGWGRPVAIRSGPGNKLDGKITLFPGFEEGSVDIEVCVLPETLKAMENDLEFMDAVTI
ncbi:unnamed protein product [Dovyalis caffra]|uniref:Uncharacterized protein n=1 Tax=Dovyalis caffra TaxID=77055 RepID=A0AAV1SNH6_9ROSI|nr:unnamed protein product [Dovyalis caffra]